jgi:uncharacterized protein (DUF2237 family)
MPRDLEGGRPRARNVLGGALATCSRAPMTGFYRDGCCNVGPEDAGVHAVCAVMTAEFLAFSASRGNDLATPMPEYGFPGLVPGDRWCLCLARWIEAHRAGAAPLIVLAATHEVVLQRVPLETLRGFAAEEPGAA